MTSTGFTSAEQAQDLTTRDHSQQRLEKQSLEALFSPETVAVIGATDRSHQLGETAEQFFSEGQEKEMLSACAAGGFKSLLKSDSCPLARR
jgi:hypothetical protein